MKTLSTPLLNNEDISLLADALLYMNMTQLRDICTLLSLPSTEKKAQLIEIIIYFIRFGSVLKLPEIPPKSRSTQYPYQPLSSTSLMLFGSYKNDAASREFFKKLIGPHFHFTAFGIDWLNDRWLQGNPPTYQEFVDYWIHETKERKKFKVDPKKEWAFIRFLQRMQTEQPNLIQKELMKEWKQLRSQKSQEAKALLTKVTECLSSR